MLMRCGSLVRAVSCAPHRGAAGGRGHDGRSAGGGDPRGPAGDEHRGRGRTEPGLERRAPPQPRTVTAQTRDAWRGDTQGLLRALGGRDNVRSAMTVATRLRVEIEDAGRIDRGALAALGPRAVAFPRRDALHVILGPAAPAAAAALRELLSRVPRGGPGPAWRARSSRCRRAALVFSFVRVYAYARHNKKKGHGGDRESPPQT